VNRVAITGVGCVTPLGLGRHALWDGLAANRSAIGEVSWLKDEVVAFRNGGEVRGYRAEDHFNASELLLYERCTQFGLLAAAEAVEGSGADGSLSATAARAGVFIGTAIAGAETMHRSYLDLYLEGHRTLHPLTVPKVMANAIAGQLAIRYGIKGPSYTYCTACASSTQAIGEAYRMIQSGRIEAALAGGSDACMTPMVWRAWEAVRAMASDTCRPFSRNRKGMVLGEGAGMLVMEALPRALGRGARILAEVAGYALNVDAADIVRPSVAGPAAAMQEALDDAGVEKSGVGYINAHGTGTILNDPCETEAIKLVFGKLAGGLSVSSSKSAVGHLMGAAGVVETIAALMPFEREIIPPTLNYLGPDPACDLDYVPNSSRSAAPRAVLKNSFAFGGLNVSLVLKRYPD
jgi:nodulation protein E